MNDIITENEALEMINRTIELDIPEELKQKLLGTILFNFRQSYNVLRTYNDVQAVLKAWEKFEN